jgi:hypothetical protein
VYNLLNVYRLCAEKDKLSHWPTTQIPKS